MSRRVPESNGRDGLCRPAPSHSANAPESAAYSPQQTTRNPASEGASGGVGVSNCWTSAERSFGVRKPQRLLTLSFYLAMPIALGVFLLLVIKG